MKLTIIKNTEESGICYIRDNPEATKSMECTLYPIVLAHEISHVRLGQIKKRSIDWRHESNSNLLLQEMACWQYVFALNEWDIEEIQYAFDSLAYTITSLYITGKVIAVYQAFRNEYLPDMI